MAERTTVGVVAFAPIAPMAAVTAGPGPYAAVAAESTVVVALVGRNRLHGRRHGPGNHLRSGGPGGRRVHLGDGCRRMRILCRRGRVGRRSRRVTAPRRP